jgi:hypothetical protein
VSGESANADVEAAEAFLETVDKQIEEKNSCWIKFSIFMKSSYSRNECLKKTFQP